MSALAGRCLCGGVTVTVRAAAARSVSLCHCDPCRRWSGTALAGFDAGRGDVEIEGDVATYASSPFAERAFCPVCGTHVWFRDVDGDAPYELSPGLFAEARGWALDREVYADRAADYLPLTGDHRRVTRAEYEARNLHVEGDAE